MVRLNLSHGTPDEHSRMIASIREQATALEREVPILLDLMGPRYRLARTENRILRRGEEVSLGLAEDGANLPVDNRQLLAHLAKGERLLIDNGLVELRITGR